MKQLILTTLLATLILLSGCVKQPLPDAQPQIDTSLPQVSVNGHIESMSSIAFEWKPLKDTRVKGYYIYRNDPEVSQTKLNRHASVEGRYASHYTDTQLTPGTEYVYRFSAFNTKGQESEASKTFRVKSKPLLHSVSFFDSIGNLPRMAKLIWRPHDNPGVKGYVLERQTVEKAQWQKIATITNRLQAEYIDKELDDNRVYKYRLRALTYEGIQSTPSNIVKVVTKPLPKEVKGLQASTSKPKSIKVSWKKSEAKDIAYYNVYRSSSANGSYNYYMKLNETDFIDKTDKDGMSYYYKVTAVDLDGLEGLRQKIPVQGNSLGKPHMPTFLDAKLINNTAVLSWKKNDERTKTYTLIKTTHLSWMSTVTKEIKGITDTSYTDKNLKPDTKYQFQVMSVDKHKITSEPTKAVDVLFTTANR